MTHVILSNYTKYFFWSQIDRRVTVIIAWKFSAETNGQLHLNHDAGCAGHPGARTADEEKPTFGESQSPTAK